MLLTFQARFRNHVPIHDPSRLSAWWPRTPPPGHQLVPKPHGPERARSLQSVRPSGCHSKIGGICTLLRTEPPHQRRHPIGLGAIALHLRPVHPAQVMADPRASLAQWLMVRRLLSTAIGNSPLAVMKIPQGRPREFPADGHGFPQCIQLSRGTTPLPEVASTRRMDSPSVTMMWA